MIQSAPITITVPLPPQHRMKSRNGKKGRLVRPLSPNARCHWRVVSKAKKAYRNSVSARILEAICRGRAHRAGWSRVTVKYDYYHETSNLMDYDNIIGSMKYALDCFVKVGVLADDDHVIPLTPGRHINPGDPRVEITIMPIDGAEHQMNLGSAGTTH